MAGISFLNGSLHKQISFLASKEEMKCQNYTIKLIMVTSTSDHMLDHEQNWRAESLSHYGLHMKQKYILSWARASKDTWYFLGCFNELWVVFVDIFLECDGSIFSKRLDLFSHVCQLLLSTLGSLLYNCKVKNRLMHIDLCVIESSF